jgi:GNAT superfamily N-acetyltransferase
MTNAWTIRRATTDDAAALQRCMHLAYATYVERMGGTRLPPMDLDYEEEIRGFPSWVATLNGNVVGGITMMFEEDHASIANVGVNPAYQGQGLGKGLMELAESEARDRGLSKLQLATHIALKENLALYQHLGWTERNRDDIRVYMSKTIG